jgi:DNA primase large subunit
MLKTASTNIKDMEASVNNSFPLCMQYVFTSLKKNSHLKHQGRLQLGLFLKGIGLNVDQSLEFWRKSFSKHTDSAKFDKEYAYNIRHNYGLEGNRKDYPPYSCDRIQKLPIPTPDENHGCPFKIFGDPKLKIMLQSLKLDDLAITNILEKKNKNEYSVLFY